MLLKWIFTGLLFSASLFASDPASITSVNFIQDGEISKLIIDIDKEVSVEKAHIKADKQILLDLKNVKSTKRILRGIDTSEFSGATVYVSPYLKPGTKDEIRFAVQLRDNVRSILEQKGNRIILNIENRFGAFTRDKIKKGQKAIDFKTAQDDDPRKGVSAPKSLSVDDLLENLVQSGVKKYGGKKISINVNNLPYRDLLKMIADVSGFNIIIDSQVSNVKPLTLSLINIPWDEALDTVLKLGNLVAFKHSNILTIKTLEQALADKQKEISNEQANKTQEPLVTRVFPISFAEPGDLVVILNDYLTAQRGSIQIDKRTSNIIVKDTVDVIERMKKIIAVLDTETPQVLIEAKVVEATENYEFKAGLGTGGISAGYDPFTGGNGDDNNAGSFSFNTATDTVTSALTASISVFRRMRNLNFTLELMESESKGKIISSPKIITQNNQSATITSTDTRQVAVSTVADGVTTTTLTPIDASINLTVTPKVTNDGSISMKIDLTKGGFTTPDTVGAAPNTSSKNISTNVLVDNGATIVIGGLYQTETNEVVNGIPFLKDLPLIGWLFRSAYNPKNTRSELIVFITPRVVNQEAAGLVNRETATAEEK